MEKFRIAREANIVMLNDWFGLSRIGLYINRLNELDADSKVYEITVKLGDNFDKIAKVQ